MCIPGTIGNGMEMLNIAKKSLYMNTFEKFSHTEKNLHIYQQTENTYEWKLYRHNLIYNLTLQSTMPDGST